MLGKFFKDYEEYPAVGLNWLLFGSSGLSGVQTPVLEKFTKCAPPYQLEHMLNGEQPVHNACMQYKEHYKSQESKKRDLGQPALL